MNVKENCNIVKDLLPNYIENLTCEETNQFIEKHLSECPYCKQIFENMKKNLNLNTTTNDKKVVKYFKKYKNKLKIFKIALVLILLIALGTMTYYYFYMKNAYIGAATDLYNMIAEGMYPDTFYATIEEISDSVLYGTKTVKVKGLEINDINHRDEFYFDVPLTNIPDNFKIKFHGTDIAFNQLKVGQNVAIYNYGDTLEENNLIYLSDVRMIVVLDNEL